MKPGMKPGKPAAIRRDWISKSLAGALLGLAGLETIIAVVGFLIAAAVYGLAGLL